MPPLPFKSILSMVVVPVGLLVASQVFAQRHHHSAPSKSPGAAQVGKGMKVTTRGAVWAANSLHHPAPHLAKSGPADTMKDPQGNRI
jgi:hypothetical protein